MTPARIKARNSRSGSSEWRKLDDKDIDPSPRGESSWRKATRPRSKTPSSSSDSPESKIQESNVVVIKPQIPERMRNDEDEEEEEEETEKSSTSVGSTSPGASPVKRAIISMPKVILKDSSGAPKPQIVLSPTAKFISTGKTGSKAQVFTLSLAPGAESKMIQAGGTVKIGNTVLRITPKTGASAPEASTSDEGTQPAGSSADAESMNNGESSDKEDEEEVVQIVERKKGSQGKSKEDSGEEEEIEEEKSPEFDREESGESRPSSAASKGTSEGESDPDYMVCSVILS